MVLYYVGFGITAVWLVVITLLLFRTRSHYHSLIHRTDKKTIEDIFNKLLKDDEHIQKDLADIKRTLYSFSEKSELHFQKIGFLRFNPFDRVGGDQSFIIALLNNEDSGIIITFLYTRDGMRVYAKRLDKGKSGEFDLSEEEKDVIRKAR